MCYCLIRKPCYRGDNRAMPLYISIRIKFYNDIVASCKEKGAWANPGSCPNFLTTPIIPGTGKATNFKFGRYIHRVHPNKRPLKILGKKEAWAYPGTAQIFSVPPIISGMGKAAHFIFCTHIFSIDRNKSPLQISGKVAVDSPNISEHPYTGRIARSSLR